MLNDSRVRALLALLAAVAAIGITVTIVNNGDDHPPGTARRTITVQLGRKDAPPVTVAIPAAKAKALAPQSGELKAQAPASAAPPLADSTPNVPNVNEEKAKAQNAATADEQTYDTSGVLKGGTAEPAHLTCHTAGHGAARTISKIRLGAVHVTVSPNVKGLADVAGLCRYFAGQKLSATWIVDNEGNSAENEPLTTTPWTQAFYNTYSCSIEFVGYTGRPGEGASSWTDVQYREGARLMAGCFKRAGIPVRNGSVTAGGIIKTSGIISHQELGLLGGGHTDPGPRFNRTRFLSLVRAYATTGSSYVATPTDKTTCRKLNVYRRDVRRHVKVSAHRTKINVARRKALEHRGITCTTKGPVRR